MNPDPCPAKHPIFSASTHSLAFLAGDGDSPALYTRRADCPITETDRRTPVAGSTGVGSRHELRAAGTSALDPRAGTAHLAAKQGAQRSPEGVRQNRPGKGALRAQQVLCD